MAARVKQELKESSLLFPVGTGYFQDCQYFEGPAIPPNAYPGQLAYPCITSLDDDTGVIISGEYNISANWILTSTVWSYNFKSGEWKNLASVPFLLYNFNCIGVKLASGKNAILATGEQRSSRLLYKGL